MRRRRSGARSTIRSTASATGIFWSWIRASASAIVDYDRVPKTAYWLMKRAQAPVALSFAYKDALESQLAGSRWSAPVWVINDTDKEVTRDGACGAACAERRESGGGRFSGCDCARTAKAWWGVCVDVAADGGSLCVARDAGGTRERRRRLRLSRWCRRRLRASIACC